ncbi:MAG: hypothetical protein COU31_02145 [Candidatus Magasanikbacteria bacterium CG10_big_fil_rev_8_21_14_0_10_40_10]|uniref:Rod shape-determining protein MreD n=1 Tax=Candidatus Magasanikbacteria bacterium CG10_big_fil_rev_8_21_14_0_10_40_10 TaxID=1974648 RepID=A0A2M6W4C8_9BACT|nr:MAG: hypothetical protein COU31_02145 [Candidatus Magasanikbacteria bacterium CG10_big_fil_rev_8_21_14_0_10_40_10]
MQIFKHSFFGLVTMLVTLFQISAIRTIGEHSFITLPIIILMLYLLIEGFRLTLIHTLIAGFIFDIFSTQPFGTYTVILLIIVFLGSLIMATTLSVKSNLPILFLVFLSSIFFYLTLEFVEYFVNNFLHNSNSSFYTGTFLLWMCVAVVLNSVSVLALYRIFSSKRNFKLKPYMVR